MKDRLVGKLSLGFILGAVLGNLIVLFINLTAKTGYMFATPTMIDSFGKEGAVLLQSLFSGLYGLVCFGGTEFYRIEKWSLLKSTVAHLGCILISFSLIGLLLGWIGFDLPSLLFLLSIVVAFFVIWLIMRAIWKKNVREMNAELEKYKEENSK